MTIAADAINKTAELARIKIDPDEIALHLKNLQAILDLAEQLRQIDTSAIQPATHSLSVVQRLRPDKVTETVQRDNLQHLTTHTHAGLYYVPLILE